MDEEDSIEHSETRPTGSPSRTLPVPSLYPGREEGRPQELSPTELALTMREGGAEEGPTLAPPARIGGIAPPTAWQRNHQVTALWANDQGRNSWVYIAGAGWLRLAGASDSAVLALTLLSAHARQIQASIDYRVETDGPVHEIYVW